MDYERIRHAVKTGDKILDLARSLGLDPESATIKDLADTVLQNALNAMAEDGLADGTLPLS